MESKKLKILIWPIQGLGHIYPCIGIGQRLKERGHRVIVVIENAWKNRLAKQYGLEEVCTNDDGTDGNDAGLNRFVQMMTTSGLMENQTPEEKLSSYLKLISSGMAEKIQEFNERFKQTLDKIAPDLIIHDNFIATPALQTYGCPWISLIPSGALMALDDERTPPPFSGKIIFNSLNKQHE